jgi:diadenosine tetraphosphate (Ap4A) HIT family hydrolase
MKQDDCPFCQRKDNCSMSVLESENFFVFPSLGQLVEGYLLICGKEHYLSCSEIPQEQFSEFLDLKEKVRKTLSKNYTNPIFFEHGCISSDRDKKAGCCVEHAHLHCVPADVDLLDGIERNFKARKIFELSEIKELHKRAIPYFYYESGKGEKYIFELHERAPSQYLRQVLAVKLGVPERWDWKTCPCHDDVSRTYMRLKNPTAL